MTHAPALDIATQIGSEVASLTLGTNLFVGTVRGHDSIIPINAVFVWGQGGPEPLRTMGEPNEIRTGIAHVRVRNSKFNDGDTLIREIMDHLYGHPFAQYLWVRLAIGEPRAMGQDSDGAHYFGIEYLATWQSD